MTNQLALEFATEKLHGCITVHFATGRRPVRCSLMASDSLWHDGEGESATEAITNAIDKSGDEKLSKAWAQWHQ